MSHGPLGELLIATRNGEHAEVGGSHNQKGIEFQKHWALMRMFELVEAGNDDFLFLFEAIQDIAVLDSETSPTRISIYQVKKKDRNEWTWGDLTSLHVPATQGKKGTKQKPLESVKSSPLGKLYATVRVFSHHDASGGFVSNAGCDFPLENGKSAATSLPAALSKLAPEHRALLLEGLASFHAKGEPPPDLSRLFVEKTVLAVEDPGTHLVGAAHTFLLKRSPPHAGQARALVDSLLAQISPLAAHTAHCWNFIEIRKQHGYSRTEFTSALGTLETIPDVAAVLKMWLHQLGTEGMSFWDTTGIHTAAAAIIQRQVMGVTAGPKEKALACDCDKWLASVPIPMTLLPFFESAHAALNGVHTSFERHELLAHFALRAIPKCVDQT